MPWWGGSARLLLSSTLVAGLVRAAVAVAAVVAGIAMPVAATATATATAPVAAAAAAMLLLLLLLSLPPPPPPPPPPPLLLSAVETALHGHPIQLPRLSQESPSPHRLRVRKSRLRSCEQRLA